eukprot:CAMPEP_0115571112 /NCGR_PEP_ID=MMETSP0271-20121206/106044_1 /TAXON_ID=71861 /ORGANISM="Scrippsiella trochoidea, Strain CCMP3099" /LENGTH=408 /DNA_ID=CAMNT_0003005665 /DNA_START=207 /DNA_END=1430 /DNA_ORIENTATION=+
MLHEVALLPEEDSWGELIEGDWAMYGNHDLHSGAKKLVVGDLPFNGRGDFYISVECAANPPMVTSLAEEKLPKVVHFPEVITLRLRWSPLEERVKITVKELNVLGSQELCQVHISAMTILDWSTNPHDRMKRLEMKPIDPTLERPTPSWILLEFDKPMDGRDLEHFHGQVNTVRTATKDGHYQDFEVGMFKHEYTLLDSTGHAIQEPLEEDLRGLACLSRCVQVIHHALACWGVVALVAFAGFRVWIAACYRRTRWVTMAYLKNTTFPIATSQLRNIVSQCHAEVAGTGAAPGVPCRPNYEQVLQLCKPADAGGLYPPAQPPVQAFEDMTQRIVGLRTGGLPCQEGFCELHHTLQEYDLYLPFVVLAYFLLCCVFRICGNELVRARKYSLQRNRAQETKRMNAEYATT